MLRPVELLALLYGSDLEVSPADEDVYVRAFPRPVTQTSSRISLHSLFGERLWPDFHRLERCRYGLRTLLVKLRPLHCQEHRRAWLHTAATVSLTFHCRA